MLNRKEHIMSKQRKRDLFSADVPFTEEIKESGLDNTVGGNSTTDLSSRLGNHGRFCTLTKECQRICRWW